MGSVSRSPAPRHAVQRRSVYCAAIRVKSSSVVSIVGSCLMHSYAGRASVAPTGTPFQRHVVRRRDGWNAVVTIDRHRERISA
jgi:hypothetical protein